MRAAGTWEEVFESLERYAETKRHNQFFKATNDFQVNTVKQAGGNSKQEGKSVPPPPKPEEGWTQHKSKKEKRKEKAEAKKEAAKVASQVLAATASGAEAASTTTGGATQGNPTAKGKGKGEKPCWIKMDKGGCPGEKDGTCRFNHDPAFLRQCKEAKGSQGAKGGAKGGAQDRARSSPPTVGKGQGQQTDSVKGKGKGKQSRQFCKYFAQGDCRHGDNCRFSHEIVRNSLQYIAMMVSTGRLNLQKPPVPVPEPPQLAQQQPVVQPPAQPVQQLALPQYPFYQPGATAVVMTPEARASQLAAALSPKRPPKAASLPGSPAAQAVPTVSPQPTATYPPVSQAQGYQPSFGGAVRWMPETCQPGGRDFEIWDGLEGSDVAELQSPRRLEPRERAQDSFRAAPMRLGTAEEPSVCQVAYAEPIDQQERALLYEMSLAAARRGSGKVDMQVEKLADIPEWIWTKVSDNRRTATGYQYITRMYAFNIPAKVMLDSGAGINTISEELVTAIVNAGIKEQIYLEAEGHPI